MRLGFRHKLFLALGGMVFLSLVVVLVTLESVTSQQIQKNFVTQFQSTLATFKHTQALQRQFIQDEVASLSRHNPQFRTILSTASIDTEGLGIAEDAANNDPLKDANHRLNSLLPSLILNEKSDIFFVTNAFGQLLYSKVSPNIYGLDLSQNNLLVQAFEADAAAAIWHGGQAISHDQAILPKQQEALYQVIATPIIFGEEVHGFVVAGQRIDQASLDSLKQMTALDLVLYAKDRVYGSTLDAPTAQFLFANAQRYVDNRHIATQKLTVNAQEFLLIATPLLENESSSHAGFFIIESLTEAMAFVSHIQRLLMMIGAVILFVALLIGYRLSKNISQPVAVLSEAAIAVGQGDLDTQVTLKTGDEFEHLGQTFNDMTAGLKERAFIKDTFERYVSKEVADEIIKHPELARLGGAHKEITMLFSDIGGFTTLSEQLDADRVLHYLNQYFETLSNIIMKHNGTLSQFQGDAIVAFWGAPLEQDNHAQLACQSAVESNRALHALKQRWLEEGLYITEFRIGVHTGETVVGNVGTQDRFAYTIIGDNANLASRMEGANKYYGTSLLISETTWRYCQEKVLAREVDAVTVKGRTQPVRIFEPIDPTLVETPERWLPYFEAGLKAYRGKDWSLAEEAFNQVLGVCPSDGPSKAFLERIHNYRQHPPADDWVGVFELTSK